MATKIIKALVDGVIQNIEVEDMSSPEQMLSPEERLDILEDKHEVVISEGSMLVGNGTPELKEMAPDEVLEHINAMGFATTTTEEYEALYKDDYNTNVLYMFTDSDDRADWSQTDETAVDYIKNKPDIDGIVDDLNVRIDETKESINAITPESIGAATSEHSHDDKYYTEFEIDEQLNLKSNVGHTHNSIIEVNKNIEQKFWRGTQSEYDALGTKSDDTMYIVIDGSDDNTIIGLPSVDTSFDGKYLKVENGNWVIDDSNYTDAEKAKLAGIADGANRTIIDTTLSVSGQAADAKSVGDALATKQPVGDYATETYVDGKIAAIPTPDVSGQIGIHNTSTSAHNDIRDLISGLTTRLNTLADSDDATLDQMSEIVEYIKSNKSLIEGVTTNKVNVSDIINNLTTNVSNKPLSAAQGVALKALIDTIAVPTKVSELTNDSGYLISYTETDPTVPAWAKAASKPSYTASEVGADAAGSASEVQANLDTHTNNKSNPHGVTLSQLGVTADATELNYMDGVTSSVQTQLNNKVSDYTIRLYNGTGGNPKPVKFLTVNYSNCDSNNGVMVKVGMVSGHGNGTSYTFLQDVIININHTGSISADNFKYYGAAVTDSGVERQYGDIFWIHDSTNKIVDFYVLMGQYADVKMMPYKRLNSSSGGAVTQHTSCTVYSSGTKVWANNSDIALMSDLITLASEKVNKTTIAIDATSGDKSLILTADNSNTEWRYVYASGITSLTIASSGTFDNATEAYYTVVFKSGATSTTVTNTLAAKFTGDDCTDNIFSPSVNKTYDIGIWYSGIDWQAVVRGV